MNALIKSLAAALVAVALLLAVYAWSLSRAPGEDRSPAAASAPALALFPVVVLTQDVAPGQTLEPGMLKVERVGFPIGGALVDPQAAVGRRPTMALSAGTPLLETQLAAGLALKVGPGERAVAVRVDDQVGAGHRIRPGDWVDIFFTLRRDGQELVDSETRLLLSRLRVLGYGAESVDGPPGAASVPRGPGGAVGEVPLPPGAGRQESPRVAVLAVPVDQVPPLVLAHQQGSLTLALRHPDDAEAPTAQPALEPAPALPLAASSAPRSPADRALAGISLSGVAGEKPLEQRPESRPGGGAPAPRAAGPIVLPDGMVLGNGESRRRQAQRAADTVEVIRGGKLETVPY